MRWKPSGSTWITKRRMNSSTSSVISLDSTWTPYFCQAIDNYAYFGEIRAAVALRLGRPRRFAAGLGGGVAGGGAIGLTRGGRAILTQRNTAARIGEASVRTSQSAWR